MHAARNGTIQLALIGCGGRGAGAVANAMSAGGLVVGDNSGRQASASELAGASVKLIAMADIRQDRLDEKYGVLKETLGDRVDLLDGDTTPRHHDSLDADTAPAGTGR